MEKSKKLTDNEIVKALECCTLYEVKRCENCPMMNLINCKVNLQKHTLDLINRLQEEKNDLFYKLTGVMHSVDKWLDGDELKEDEVNRAATMREKTLQIAESLQAENERLKNALTDHEYGNCVAVKNGLIYTHTLEDYDELIGDISAEAYKEFAERLKMLNNGNLIIWNEQIDNLLKELVGEDK